MKKGTNRSEILNKHRLRYKWISKKKYFWILISLQKFAVFSFIILSAVNMKILITFFILYNVLFACPNTYCFLLLHFYQFVIFLYFWFVMTQLKKNLFLHTHMSNHYCGIQTKLCRTYIVKLINGKWFASQVNGKLNNRILIQNNKNSVNWLFLKRNVDLLKNKFYRLNVKLLRFWTM